MMMTNKLMSQIDTWTVVKTVVNQPAQNQIISEPADFTNSWKELL